MEFVVLPSVSYENMLGSPGIRSHPQVSENRTPRADRLATPPLFVKLTAEVVPLIPMQHLDKWCSLITILKSRLTEDQRILGDLLNHYEYRGQWTFVTEFLA